ncbi:RluA family pseudouridine synthase [Gilvimarinus agarilyticus]|uniref:RluA family pseudouridine synthase n=1 Tax=Gilvimarinus agarilyticus TaxID=679259 RepID=UPI0005A13CE6|nr:RluA family pseudouridine synthase [Gilvimarinus agarilyticus]
MSNSSDDLAVLPKCHEPVDIVREDEGFVLVVKPAGLLSVPGRNRANYDCVLGRLQMEYPHASMIHRLDFDTSGIMVVARHKRAHAAIARQFEQRTTRKVYIAIVAGKLSDPAGEIDMPIAPDKDHRPRYKICETGGKPSITRYRVLSYDAATDTSRLELTPLTGRSHQLRVHLSAIGHPILGCHFYAPEPIQAAAPRLLLHAAELEFVGPDDGARVVGRAECPF